MSMVCYYPYAQPDSSNGTLPCTVFLECYLAAVCTLEEMENLEKMSEQICSNQVLLGTTSLLLLIGYVGSFSISINFYQFFSLFSGSNY